MRLLTRSDFDGICCAALLKEIGLLEEMVYAHPKDLQDGKIEVTSNDILANVPYVEGCGLWFDHHSSEEERLELEGRYKGRSEPAPSAARVIYNYYDSDKFRKYDEMMNYVDKVDSAQLSRDDILEPKRWVLLGFICDPRTGLGYHKEYRISNMELMQNLVDQFMTMSIDEILNTPDMKERVDRYFRNNETFKNFLVTNSRADGPIAITDTRGISEIPPGNRFLIYSIYPDTNISIRLIDGKDKAFVSFSVGYSILNRTSKVDVGSLMLKYGGGGHKAVGTCQVPYDNADRVLGELAQAIKSHP
jgi:oligoribonuclease NrnB/cAMP/cGMP phosphodiesterase (DHH superfamily)